MAASKPCKYGCGVNIEWDNAISGFVETQTAERHTPDRCKSIRAKKGFADTANKAVNSAFTDKPTLERIERKLDTQIELLQSLLIKLGLTNTAKKLQDDLESDPYHQEGPG